MRLLTGIVGALAVVAFATVPASAQYMERADIEASAAKAEGFPSGPIDFVCTTRPGSSVAAWCHNLARGFSEELGVPVEVQFKSGGSQHEPPLLKPSTMRPRVAMTLGCDVTSPHVVST